MPRLIVLLAAGSFALSAHAVAQTPPPGMTPEKARELGMKGAALFELLKAPSRCGAPVVKGYACALVLYKDVSEDRDRDRLPETLTARVTGMTGVDGPVKDAEVRLLSPFDASPRSFSPVEMTRLRMTLTSDRHGAEIATLEMQGVLGYAENEALASSNPRKIDRNRFKLPR